MKFKFEVEVENEEEGFPYSLLIDGRAAVFTSGSGESDVVMLLIQKFHELRIGIDRSKAVKA